MIFILYFFYLSFISLISCGQPTFEIKEVNYALTRCNRNAGFFEFVFKGKGKNIEDSLRIALPLKSPASSKALCKVSSTDIICTLDVLLYDIINPTQKVVIDEEEPIFDNLKITNWVDFFIPERRVINDEINCKSNEVIIDPEESDELYIFGSLDKNIDILGCLKNKNNFIFKIILIKPNNPDSEIILKEDLNFDIYFEKPKDEKINCLIKNDNNKLYTVKCSMEYGGEIDIGAQANGIAYIGEKKVKIVIRGILILPTIVDQCTDDKNNY